MGGASFVKEGDRFHGGPPAPPADLGELRVRHRRAPGEAEALCRREPSVARGPSTLGFMPPRPVCRGQCGEGHGQGEGHWLVEGRRWAGVLLT